MRAGHRACFRDASSAASTEVVMAQDEFLARSRAFFRFGSMLLALPAERERE